MIPPSDPTPEQRALWRGDGMKTREFKVDVGSEKMVACPAKCENTRGGKVPCSVCGGTGTAKMVNIRPTMCDAYARKMASQRAWIEPDWIWVQPRVQKAGESNEEYAAFQQRCAGAMPLPPMSSIFKNVPADNLRIMEAVIQPGKGSMDLVYSTVDGRPVKEKLGAGWKRPICWLFGHVQRWSPDDADDACRRCGKWLSIHPEPPNPVATRRKQMWRWFRVAVVLLVVQIAFLLFGWLKVSLVFAALAVLAGLRSSSEGRSMCRLAENQRGKH